MKQRKKPAAFKKRGRKLKIPDKGIYQWKVGTQYENAVVIIWDPLDKKTVVQVYQMFHLATDEEYRRKVQEDWDGRCCEFNCCCYSPTMSITPSMVRTWIDEKEL